MEWIGQLKPYKYQFQTVEQIIDEDESKIALYWDMGTGKTMAGAELVAQWKSGCNLVICQKSKIKDWIQHFNLYYPKRFHVLDLTDECLLTAFFEYQNLNSYSPVIGVINYELTFRRPELLQLEHFTLLLDESSLIQNEQAKRTKFVLDLADSADHIALLSGTPTGGKYERLYSQIKLLGWPISKKLYWNQFIIFKYLDTVGRSVPIVTGYKNINRLKRKMRYYGCRFLKSEEVTDLPEQIYITVNVDAIPEYKRFRKLNLVIIEDPEIVELVGDSTLKKMLYERQLSGQYNYKKLQAFKDLVESTDDRLIVFYNFTAELESLMKLVKNVKPISIVNGSIKDLNAYEQYSNSVTFIQYQAGAMGLNLQLANKVIYFTPPLSSELFEQSKKRIHRIGQNNTCFYYQLIVDGSIEEHIYKTLEKRQNYTERLFENDTRKKV